MTLCNMTIEAGGRAGMVAPDEVTCAYLKGRPFAPTGVGWDRAVQAWRALKSDEGAVFEPRSADRRLGHRAHGHLGQQPRDALPIGAAVPDPAAAATPERREAMERAIAYMGLTPGQALDEIAIDRVFIGSCTNGRLEDLESAAAVVRGRKVAPGVEAWVVPGSGPVKAAAQALGLDKVFKDAGFDWREPGCSMCLGTNGDQVASGQRCASTTTATSSAARGRVRAPTL